MIEAITIDQIATFTGTPVSLSGLGLRNFVYGANGTGKTTLSNLLANPDEYPSCSIKWKADNPLQTVVYNRKFVDDNFGKSQDGDDLELAGIFTLGEESTKVQKQLGLARTKLTKEQANVDNLEGTLDEKKKANSEAKKVFQEACWTHKCQVEVNFKPALKGALQRRTFAKKVQDSRASNLGKACDLADLSRRASSLYPTAAQPVSIVQAPNGEDLELLGQSERLGRAIVGRTDIPIAALIQRLNNADWVRQGQGFLAQTNDVQCPFCQQTTGPDLKQQLDAFFDESFEQDMGNLRRLVQDYRAGVTVLGDVCREARTSDSPFLDPELLKVHVELVDRMAKDNLTKVERKLDNPGMTIQLDDLAPNLQAAQQLVETANARATEHNRLLVNRNVELQRLHDDVWRYTVDLLEDDLNLYNSTTTSNNRAIASLTQKIDDGNLRVSDHSGEIKALEQQITSVKPTVTAINAVLRDYEFNSFSLAEAPREGFYRLVRPGGQDATETLSEGERTFITLLYFLHLLRGSHSETGVSAERVVAFDDPISSLDSDVLFVVSSLIQEILHQAGETGSTIRQVFVLTHNVYFHKEVSFDRKGAEKTGRTWWTVHKPNGISTIRKHDRNPVSTSYEMLWQQLRSEDSSLITIRNTMRRILETYFKILGKVSYDEEVTSFKGKNLSVFRSLIQWINDGSHGAWDDPQAPRDGVTVDRYKKVFERIFKNLGHEEHYRMMMREEAE